MLSPHPLTPHPSLSASAHLPRWEATHGPTSHGLSSILGPELGAEGRSEYLKVRKLEGETQASEEARISRGGSFPFLESHPPGGAGRLHS